MYFIELYMVIFLSISGFSDFFVRFYFILHIMLITIFSLVYHIAFSRFYTCFS